MESYCQTYEIKVRYSDGTTTSIINNIEFDSDKIEFNLHFIKELYNLYAETKSINGAEVVGFSVMPYQKGAE